MEDVKAKPKRQLDNWIQSFMELNLPRSVAPESFIKWAGIFSIAATLERNVKIGKKYLGGWECAPNMYVFFIGPQGGPKKTTTMNFSIDILRGLTFLVKGPDMATQASLLNELVNSDRGAIYLTIEEFSDLIMKSGGNEMYEFLTSMYDGKRDFKSTTIGRGVEFAEKPCMNMLAATTPVWLSKNMSEDVIGGGFASRFIPIYEEDAREVRMYYRGTVDVEANKKLEEKLQTDLIHIHQYCQGEFEIDDDALVFMEQWNKEHEAKKKTVPHKLIGYHNRKATHVHKLAMVLHCARSDDLVLSVEDFQNALMELSLIEKNMPRVYEGMGKNPYTFDMRHIFEYVEGQGQIEKSALLAHFASSAPPSMLTELISGLCSMGLMESFFIDKQTHYRIKKK